MERFMPMHTGWKHDSGKKLLLVAAGISLVSQMMPVSPCLALSINLGSSKKAALQSPGYAKLDEGAGPSTNDILQSLDRTDDKPAAKPVSLAPVTLSSEGKDKEEQDTAPTITDSSSESNSNADFKLSAQQDKFVPKTPGDLKGTALGAVSIKDQPKDKDASVNDKLMKNARKNNLLPIPLMESAEETQQKLDTAMDAQKAQLADLWEATLSRSPDIQFVTQRLMPTSNKAHTGTMLMRFLSSAVFGAAGAVGMMAPNAGVMMGTNAGAQALYNLVNQGTAAANKKAQLSETECIMLYTIVRNTADKLVADLREYKKFTKSFNTSATDLSDLQNMLKDARGGQDNAKTLEMEYTVRKAQRDVEKESEEVQRYRQALVDLAGGDAVSRLDNQLVAEEQKLQGDASGDSKAQLATPNNSTL
jgi:hypothetical protein